MQRDLIVNSTPLGVEIALLEDNRLVELQREKLSDQFSVGDIYLGRVRKLVPGLNAAFVDVGYEKDAFLHYTDLGPKIKSLLKVSGQGMAGNLNDPLLTNFEVLPDNPKGGKIKDVLQPKAPLLIQILKEPISTKGPRLSCELTLAGRFLVLVPFSNVVAVSKKIASSDERKRLHKLIESIRPKNFGIVVRTSADGKKVSELHEDLNNLIGRWETLAENLKGAQPPKKVLGEIDKTSSILRDLLNASFNKIVTNDKTLFSEVQTYIERISPEHKDQVTLYKGSQPLFDAFGITKQIKSLFGKTVTMPGGSYLVIEHTEALHVIDVNSGQRISQSEDQESTALAVNKEAMAEIARQLRLRDLGGIIVVDFIDMKNPDHKKLLHQLMKEQMDNDRAKHTILPLSKFGLMQITRQRVKPEINIVTSEVCPSCQGTGKVSATILGVDVIERTLDLVLKEQKSVRLEVHPFIDAFLKNGFPSIRMKWSWKYKSWIKISPNNDFALTDFRVYNEEGTEVTV